MGNYKSNLKLATDLLSAEDYKNYLTIISEYGVAQTGGSSIISLPLQGERLVHDINLLISRERKQLIYSEIISKN